MELSQWVDIPGHVNGGVWKILASQTRKNQETLPKGERWSGVLKATVYPHDMPYGTVVFKLQIDNDRDPAFICLNRTRKTWRQMLIELGYAQQLGQVSSSEVPAAISSTGTSAQTGESLKEATLTPPDVSKTPAKAPVPTTGGVQVCLYDERGRPIMVRQPILVRVMVCQEGKVVFCQEVEVGSTWRKSNLPPGELYVDLGTEFLGAWVLTRSSSSKVVAGQTAAIIFKRG